MDIGLIIFLCICGLFFVASITILIVVLYRLKWNVKWVLMEEQPNGKLEITKRGRCRRVAFGDGGEEVYLLKGLNKLRTAYGKKIGKNQIAWAVGQDGYWYPIEFQGIDKRLREIGVFPVHMDMRLAYASIREMNNRRHQTQTFMEKWGTAIAFGLLAICILGMIAFSWYTFKGVKDVQDASTKSLDVQKEVMEKTAEVIGKLDILNRNNQPSGVRTVTTT